MPRVRLVDYTLGLHGLAVVRNWLRGGQVSAKHVQELRDFADAMERNAAKVEFELSDDEIAQGYAAWSVTYDQPTNPLIGLEQPIVRSLIDAIPAGRALDAACGTGRHTEYLCARGFDTVGVDLTPEMLALAREKAPSARFVAGDLLSLDFSDETFDLAICALALEHCSDLLACTKELARVVRSGGAIIVSEFHPMSAALGGGAFYRDAEGKWRKVRSSEHQISDYINAFVQSGLRIDTCVEAPWGEKELAMMGVAGSLLKPETLHAAMAGIPCALVWRLTRS